MAKEKSGVKSLTVLIVVTVLIVGITLTLLLVPSLRNGIIMTIKSTIGDTIGLVNNDEKQPNWADVIVNETSNEEEYVYEDEVNENNGINETDANLRVLLPNTSGDMVILKEDKTIMFNTGFRRDYELIKQYLREHSIEKLDYLIITHYRESSNGNFLEIFKSLNPTYILLADNVSKNKNSKYIIDYLEENGVVWTEPIDGQRIDIGETKVTLFTTHDEGSLLAYVNNRSDEILLSSDIVKVERIPRGLFANLDIWVLTHTIETYEPPQMLNDLDVPIVIVNNRRDVDATKAIELLKRGDRELYLSSECSHTILYSTGKGIKNSCEKTHNSE